MPIIELTSQKGSNVMGKVLTDKQKNEIEVILHDNYPNGQEASIQISLWCLNNGYRDDEGELQVRNFIKSLGVDPRSQAN